MLQCVCVLLPDIHVHTETTQTMYNCDRIGFCHFFADNVKPMHWFLPFLAE